MLHGHLNDVRKACHVESSSSSLGSACTRMCSVQGYCHPQCFLFL
jgi:hypothetical protein